nr:hypothetical protein HmN_000893600 [Hymenolepis microstoma]
METPNEAQIEVKDLSAVHANSSVVGGEKGHFYCLKQRLSAERYITLTSEPVSTRNLATRYILREVANKTASPGHVPISSVMITDCVFQYRSESATTCGERVSTRLKFSPRGRLAPLDGCKFSRPLRLACRDHRDTD